jgi:hypothetical protein
MLSDGDGVRKFSYKDYRCEDGRFSRVHELVTISIPTDLLSTRETGDSLGSVYEAEKKKHSSG